MIMIMMSEHGLGGRPEAASGGQSQAAACQHGRDTAQPRGDGSQVWSLLSIFELKLSVNFKIRQLTSVSRYIEESLPQHCSGLWAVINNAGMIQKIWSRAEH